MRHPELSPDQPSNERTRLVDRGVVVGLGVLVAGFVAIGAFVALTSNARSEARPETPEQLQFSAQDLTISRAGTLWLDTADADTVAQAFVSEFSKSVPAIEWDGDHRSCDGGTSSAALRQATIDRVNFYRAMAGVPAVVVENEAFSEMAHSGAIMMSVEGELTHDPQPSFACYTETGFDAASNSNLYLGRTGPNAIDGYVEDPGENNADVGHRNTLLHPPTTEMGVANVASQRGYDEANLVWVFDDKVFEKQTEIREAEGYVAWPPRGFVPQELVHERWSFSLPGADFTDATVSVSLDGESVSLSSVTREGKQGRVPNPIIVWEQPVELASAELNYQVQVSGVLLDGAERDYEYSVNVLAPLLN